MATVMEDCGCLLMVSNEPSEGNSFATIRCPFHGMRRRLIKERNERLKEKQDAQVQKQVQPG